MSMLGDLRNKLIENEEYKKIKGGDKMLSDVSYAITLGKEIKYSDSKESIMKKVSLLQDLLAVNIEQLRKIGGN